MSEGFTVRWRDYCWTQLFALVVARKRRALESGFEARAHARFRKMLSEQESVRPAFGVFSCRKFFLSAVLPSPPNNGEDSDPRAYTYLLGPSCH